MSRELEQFPAHHNHKFLAIYVGGWALALTARGGTQLVQLSLLHKHYACGDKLALQDALCT